MTALSVETSQVNKSGALSLVYSSDVFVYLYARGMGETGTKGHFSTKHYLKGIAVQISKEECSNDKISKI